MAGDPLDLPVVPTDQRAREKRVMKILIMETTSGEDTTVLTWIDAADEAKARQRRTN